ncbi:MAG: type VI secretion system tip protein VgrG, partial [Calditrichales bacterium]
MVQYKHNEPYYTLQLSELADGAVRVLAFEGAEQISHLFHYRLELLSEDAELDPAAILNKKATLFFNRGDGDPLPVHGIISHFEQRGRTPDYVSYYAELVPRMWRLELNFQSRVFQNLNIEQMITEVLESAEFAGEDFEFKLNETYPDIEFALQYRETDFNFINRRLEHFGIFYYFEHKDEKDVIVFTDVNDNLPAIETEEDITYNANKDPLSERETVSRFIYQGQVVTGKTQLKDYNYQTPSKELLAESQINSDNPGIHSDYGDHFKDESEGDFQARIRDEEIACRGTLYKGTGDCRAFHAGYLFTMNEHYREDWNQEFLLKKVVSRGNQRNLFGTFPSGSKVPPTYENIFESIPVSIPFRPRREALQPKISGVLNAKIDAAGDGSQAEVDDQGRYKVILPFDLSGNADGEASCFMRMIQPYAGPNYGMHFPLHKGTEVLLTFIDGDPDLPVISGAVPNPETISPVTNANPTKSVIRDNYGNEIVMDATPGDEHIRLHSPHHNSGLDL